MQEGRGRLSRAPSALAALVAVVLLATSAGGSSGSYTVRAIFDDAGNIISGENVKVDGVKVGTVGSVTPTPQAKAAVVLNIDNPGFQDFRADASCTIRPQALIGEKFVDCLPTQPRVEGTPLPPPLKTIPQRPGRRRAGAAAGDEHPQPGGRRPARRHHPPARGRASDDHPQRARRRSRRARQRPERGHPSRQPGAAGTRQGVRDPRRARTRCWPSSRSTPTRALAPFAAVRDRVADFIVQSNTVAQATADHRGALARNLADFPAFLEQLGPAMERLGRFADQTTPTFTDLGIAAPGIDQAFTAPGARSRKLLRRFFKSLGKTAKVSGPALAVEPSRCSGRCRRWARTPSRSRATSPNCSPACARRAASSACSTSSSSAPARSTAMTRSVTSCAPRAWSSALPHLRDRPSSPGAAPNCSARRRSRRRRPRRPASAGASTTSLVMARTLAVLKGATPAAGARQISRLGPDRRRTRGHGRRRAGADRHRPAGGRRKRGHHLLHALLGKLGSGRHAAQLPARQLTMTMTARHDSPAAAPGRGRARLARSLAPGRSRGRTERRRHAGRARRSKPPSPTPAPHDRAAAGRRARRTAPTSTSTPTASPAPGRRARRTTATARRRCRPSTRREALPAPPGARPRACEGKQRPARAWRTRRTVRSTDGSAGRAAKRRAPALGAHAAAAARAQFLDRREYRASSSKASASRRSCCRSTRRRARPTAFRGRCSLRSTRLRPTTAAT